MLNEKQINDFLNIWVIADYLRDYVDHHEGELYDGESQMFFYSHYCDKGELKNIELNVTYGFWHCESGDCHQKYFGFKKHSVHYGTILELVCLIKKCDKRQAIQWVNDLIERRQ